MEGLAVERQRQNSDLISETHYETDESFEFNDYVRDKPRQVVRQEEVSKPTKTDVLVSTWHVPCHAIICRTSDGLS